VRIGPTISPTLVSGLNIAASNSGTIRPGGKLPREPPWLDEEHVENSRAQSSKVRSPEEIIFMMTFASPSDSTKMCRAVAFTASGGGPYSSFEKALEIESKIPILNDNDSPAFVPNLPCVTTEFVGMRNADIVGSIKIRCATNIEPEWKNKC